MNKKKLESIKNPKFLSLKVEEMKKIVGGEDWTYSSIRTLDGLGGEKMDTTKSDDTPPPDGYT